MKKALLFLSISFLAVAIKAQTDIDCTQNMLKTHEEITECSLQAESWCKLKLQHAQIILEDLKGKSQDAYSAEDKIAAEKLEHFFGIKPVEYGGQLPWVIETIQKVRNLPAVKFVYAWEEGTICKEESDAYGRTDGGDNTNIYLCNGWEMRSLKCRRQTVMHEMLHLVGLKDWTEEAKTQNDGFVRPVGWRMTDADNFSRCMIALVYTSKGRDELKDDICKCEAVEE
jgi:hypothetical protein